MSTLARQDVCVSRSPAKLAGLARQVGLDARNNTAAFVFLAPWVVGMLCLTLGPILASFYLSLTSYDMFTPPVLDRPRQLREDVHRGPALLSGAEGHLHAMSFSRCR